MFLLLVSSLLHVSAQEMRAISRAELEQVRVAMAIYYTDCGYFPRKLQEILEATRKIECGNGGGNPPLAPTRENRRLLTKLVYKPLSYDNLRKGFQDYEMWVKVLWIPPTFRARTVRGQTP